MTGIPLDHYEDLIADELCAYQALLDRGEAPARDSASGRAIPAELRPALDNFRRCLDLLHAARRQALKRQAAGRSQGAIGAGDAPVHTLPSRIGRFPIFGQLGLGGFGIVFLGLDPETKRKVAIKVPRVEFLESGELIERFRQEAASAARLDHPNILGIFESDFQAIPPYIVTPYVEGASLAEWRASQSAAPAPQIAAEIIRQLAEGVAHAHKKGVLHRDLKPANVLLAPRESDPGPGELSFVPKLTDFGLAKCADLASQHTRTGTVLGTASYMAPEQAQGRSKEINESTDVYGLGAILYELLTGAPPFRGENDLQTVQEILRDEPRTPRSRNSQLPVDLEVICLKCLDKAPASRYASAREVADDLGRFLRGEPIRARRISWTRRLGKWCRRHPARAAALGAAMLGLLTLLCVSLWYNARLSEQLKISEHARETAQKERKTAEEQRQIARQQASEIRRRGYVSDMRAAKLAWDQENVEQTLRLLERYQPREGEPDLRNFAWWYLWRESHEASRALGVHEGGATAVALTADGKLAASGGADSVIRLWSLPAGTLRAELRGHRGGPIHDLGFSPDGARLVSAGDDATIRLWDPAKAKELAVGRGHTSWVARVAYSPQGDVIASAGADGTVRLWEPETCKPTWRSDAHGKNVRCLAFHPTEPLLVTGGRDGAIRFWNLAKRAPDARLPNGMIALEMPGDWLRALVFAPDGNCLVAAVDTADGTIEQFSLKSTEFGTRIYRGIHFYQPRCLCWPHDGGLLVGFANAEIGIYQRWRLDWLEASLRGHSTMVSSIAATRDGSSVVSAGDERILYWPNVLARSVICINANPSAESTSINRVQWSGGRLAAQTAKEELTLFQMPGRKPERTFPKAWPGGFALSPSGRLLLTCSPNGMATCFRSADSQPLWTLPVPPRASYVWINASTQAIDSSESFAAIGCDREVLIVPLAAPTILHQLKHPEFVRAVAFLRRDGEATLCVSACDDGQVRFWDVAAGRLLRQFAAHRRVISCLAVSGDQRFLATGGEDRRVRVWRMDDLREIAAMLCSTWPTHVAFLEGAELLAVADSPVTIWSIRDELELLTFPGYPDRAHFAVSPDGRQLAYPAHWSIHILDGRPVK
jgi:WD40 repeat protein/tRNA A-37 threonylcarbamoyl transferase component Bud32